MNVYAREGYFTRPATLEIAAEALMNCAGLRTH
jgi:hypothetical protein